MRFKGPASAIRVLSKPSHVSYLKCKSNVVTMKPRRRAEDANFPDKRLHPRTDTPCKSNRASSIVHVASSTVAHPPPRLEECSSPRKVLVRTQGVPGSRFVFLRAFLNDPAGVTEEPAAFQLRCKQICQVPGDGTGHAAKIARKVVIVVGGKCRLWKLNQIIAECFDVSEGEFAYEHMKGTAALGSRFMVSRPLPPGHCDKVPICSSRSAEHVGNRYAFVDDRTCSVAQLWRGKSSRASLERGPAEEAQQVVFTSPHLDADVAVSLDGIMLDRYDNQHLFDKKRRHGNGRKPLPRIVRSSFLSTSEIEAKNIVMQGSREGPDFLLQIATPWSAFHQSTRRSQRKPLFQKDGGDYDMNDLCYVSGDEEMDSDVDDREPLSHS